MSSAVCECGCQITYWGEKAPRSHKCFKCGEKVEIKEIEVVQEEAGERPPLKKRGRPAGTKVKRKAN